MLSTKKLKKCLVACCYYSKSSPQGNQNSRERERERDQKFIQFDHKSVGNSNSQKRQ
jgi:hypothetical protein